MAASSGSILVLETALLSCTCILRAPPPIVMIRSLDVVAPEYELLFFVAAVELALAA